MSSATLKRKINELKDQQMDIWHEEQDTYNAEEKKVLKQKLKDISREIDRLDNLRIEAEDKERDRSAAAKRRRTEQ